MTVRELIEKLKDMDPDLPVLYQGEDPIGADVLEDAYVTKMVRHTPPHSEDWYGYRGPDDNGPTRVLVDVCWLD